MQELSKYNIDIYGLEEKQYVYDIASEDAFFEELEQDLIEHGRFTAHVELNKSATMLQLAFHIEGVVELLCDRSLEPFDYEVLSDERLILKFGDHNEELSDEIEMISRNTNRINLARYVFEYIALALPVKKIHPNLQSDDDESDDEEGILVYTSESTSANEDQEDDKIDPRWEILKKLKGN